MGTPSGKFVLRLTPQLHQRLKSEAEEHCMSLNAWVLHRLTHSPVSNELLWNRIQNIYSNSVLALVQFGSTVRGEARESSDIDLLIVLEPEITIDRKLYRIWDEGIAPDFDLPYSPQFSHLASPESPSSLWLEVALEGEILFAKNATVQSMLSRIRERIASGEFVRKMSYGQPYWVHEKKRL
jgi:predicted nucleotidyltransferase